MGEEGDAEDMSKLGALSRPTFEDLAIDPSLSDVERVVRYATGTVELQRLVHVMMLRWVWFWCFFCVVLRLLPWLTVNMAQ